MIRGRNGIGLRALACVWVLAGVGCATYVDRAHYAYRDGRYLEAAEDLASREHQVTALEPQAQAQYGLYRGLSLLQLRDAQGAQQWLGFSSAVEKRAPGSLSSTERAALERGLSEASQSVASAAQPQVLGVR